MNDEEIVSGFSATTTSTVADALLKLDLFRHSPGIYPLGAASKVVGRAFTILYRSRSVTNPGSVGDYVDDVPPGRVIVLDNRDRTDCTVWGDILTVVASGRGIAGTVIGGVCRDTERAASLGYPLFARGHTFRTGKGRVEVGAVNEPVSLGDAHVAPGDLIVGDVDGVCVVPWERVEAVLDVALAIQASEKEIERLVAEGVTLKAAREETGYFSLQDPRGTEGAR